MIEVIINQLSSFANHVNTIGFPKVTSFANRQLVECAVSAHLSSFSKPLWHKLIWPKGHVSIKHEAFSKPKQFNMGKITNENSSPVCHGGGMIIVWGWRTVVNKRLKSQVSKIFILMMWTKGKRVLIGLIASWSPVLKSVSSWLSNRWLVFCVLLATWIRLSYSLNDYDHII